MASLRVIQRLRLLLFAGMLLTVFSGAVDAQVRFGAIEGTVTDPSAGALPGVTLKLTSPALQVPEVTTVTDAQGHYRFGELRVGLYRVQAELDGFQAIVRSDIDISTGFVARIDLQMSLGSLNETVTVSGASPVVDVTTTRGGQSISTELVATVIPMSGTQPDLVRLTPGLDNGLRRMNLGMLGANGAGGITAYGQAGSTAMVEEVQMTNQTLVANMSDTEQVDVKTFGNSAEAWNAGVQTNYILKSGGNDFHGLIDGSYVNSKFQGNNLDDNLRSQGFSAPEKLDSMRSFHGNLGGPILHDKLWFFVSGKAVQVVKYAGGFQLNAGPDGRYLTGDEPTFPETIDQNGQVVKGSFQATSKYRMSGWYWRDWTKDSPIEFAGLLGNGNQRTISYEASSIYNLVPILYNGEFEGTPRDNMTFSFKASRSTYYTKYGIQDGSENLPSSWDRATGMYTGASISDGPTSTAQRYGTANWNAFVGRVSYFPKAELAGRHELKAGFNVQLVRGGASSFNQPGGNYILTFDTVNGVPHQGAEIRTLTLPTTLDNDKQDNGTAFVTDQWRLSSRVTLNLGVRFERQHIYIPESDKPAAQFANAATFQAVDIGKWMTIAPRLAMAWDVTGNGRTVFKTTFGRFNDQLPLGPTLFAEMFNPAGTIQTNYRWHDLNRNNNYDPGEVDLSTTGGDFISRTGGLGNTVPLSSSFDIPRTNEWTMALERELMPNMSARVLYVYKKSYGAYSTINAGIPFSAYNIPLQRRDPGPDGVTGNADDGQMVTIYDYDPAFRGTAFQQNARVNAPDDFSPTAQTLEIYVTKRLSRKWSMGTSFNTTKQHRYIVQSVQSPSELLNNIDNTRSKVLRMNGNYILPFDINLGGTLSVTNGVYGQRTYIFRAADPLGGPALRQLSTVTMKLDPFGTQVGPVLTELNFRLGKIVRLGGSGRQLVLNVDFFNALNGNSAQTTNWQAGPTYGQIQQIPVPRNVQFGAQFKF